MPFLRMGDGVHYYQLVGPSGKPAILFSNSLGTDLRIWDGVAARLAEQFRVIRYDKRGHGLTEAVPPPYSAGDLAADVVALLDALELEQAVICGVSVGGIVAQALALEHPERVRALILLDTGARIGTAESWQQRIDAVKAAGVASLVPVTMERWFSAGFRTHRAADVIGYSLMLRQTSADGYVGTCAALRDADFRAVLSSVFKPTLVLCGAEDIATVPELGRELASLIPGAQFALIEKAGHLACVEQPDAVAERITRFLQEVSCV